MSYGRVCRICDRKFFLRSPLIKFADDIDQIQEQISSCVKQIEQQKQDIEKYKEETAKIKELTRKEEQRYAELAETNKRRMQEMQQEQSRILN